MALVDDQDYELVMQYSWTIAEQQRKNRPGQARTYATSSPKSFGFRSVLMHQVITGWPQTDHCDGDGLNNQRSNLREATGTQNNANRHKQASPATSQYKGVHWNGRKWEARIKDGPRQRRLGYFTSEEDAARAYDSAAIAAWGEYALLNFRKGK